MNSSTDESVSKAVPIGEITARYRLLTVSPVVCWLVALGEVLAGRDRTRASVPAATGDSR